MPRQQERYERSLSSDESAEVAWNRHKLRSMHDYVNDKQIEQPFRGRGLISKVEINYNVAEHKKESSSDETISVVDVEDEIVYDNVARTDTPKM